MTVDTELSTEGSFLFDHVHSEKDMMKLLNEKTIDDKFYALDTLKNCTAILERFDERIDFFHPVTMFKREVNVEQRDQLSLLQAFPWLFDSMNKNSTMKIIHESLLEKSKVTVAIRDPNCKESFVKVTGYILYFDKHFNLVKYFLFIHS